MIVTRSGTTLMRAMLDAHPDVLCGVQVLGQMQAGARQAVGEAVR